MSYLDNCNIQIREDEVPLLYPLCQYLVFNAANNVYVKTGTKLFETDTILCNGVCSICVMTLWIKINRSHQVRQHIILEIAWTKSDVGNVLIYQVITE